MLDFEHKRMDLSRIARGETLDYASIADADRVLTQYLVGDIDRRYDEYTVVYPDTTTCRMHLGRLWLLLHFWCVLSRFNLPIRHDALAIQRANNITKKTLVNTYDTIIEQLGEARVNYHEAAPVLSQCLDSLTYSSAIANDAEGNTINLFDITRAAKQEPRVSELLNIEIPQMQLSEIEKLLERATRELMGYFVDLDTCYRPFIESQTGLNPDQVQQTFVAVGLKPTYAGDRSYNHVVRTSFLNGLRSIEDLYVVSSSARKALIISNKNVPESGRLQRRIAYLVINSMLNVDCDDCGTKLVLPVEIRSHEIAERLVGRYYVDASGGLSALRHADCASVVGKTLSFRSPIGCRNPICRTCYGQLADINYDIHVGILAMLLLTHPQIQRLLSAKHLLRTRNEHIQIPDNFKKYFYFDMNRIKILEGVQGRIRVYTDDIEPDNLTEMVDVTTRFYFVEEDDSGKEHEHEIEFNTNLVVCSMWFTDSQEEYIEINAEEYAGTDNEIFVAVIVNQDISYALERVQDLIIRKNHGGYKTIEANEHSQGLLNACLEQFDTLGLKISSIHLEVVLAELMFEPGDNGMRLDLAKYPEDSTVFPNYVLTSVDRAIQKGPDIMKAVFFERLRSTFCHPETYLDRRTQHTSRRTSIIDEVYTDNRPQP